MSFFRLTSLDHHELYSIEYEHGQCKAPEHRGSWLVYGLN